MKLFVRRWAASNYTYAEGCPSESLSDWIGVHTAFLPFWAACRSLWAGQMRGFGSSRAELFAEIDRPKLAEWPDQPYVFARWKRCRIAPDYHVEVDGHWYSTPYRLIRELVEVR